MKKTLLCLLFVAGSVFAGNTGKISGVVKDKETGDPLPGVNVVYSPIEDVNLRFAWSQAVGSPRGPIRRVPRSS